VSSSQSPRVGAAAAAIVGTDTSGRGHRAADGLQVALASVCTASARVRGVRGSRMLAAVIAGVVAAAERVDCCAAPPTGNGTRSMMMLASAPVLLTGS